MTNKNVQVVKYCTIQYICTCIELLELFDYYTCIYWNDKVKKGRGVEAREQDSALQSTKVRDRVEYALNAKIRLRPSS